MNKQGNSKIKAFLKKKDVEISFQRYFIDALGHMALGLFASLLIGTILNTIGEQLNLAFLTETVWPTANSMTGAAIGVAVAYALKAPPLVLFSSTITGAAGNALGGPAGAFLAALIGAELGKLVSKETKLDIIVTTGTTILSGAFVGSVIGPIIGGFMTATGEIIMFATELAPFAMGTIVSVVVGVVLTLPFSSAALSLMLGLEGIAAGAATAGCCAQMIGFSFMSFKENGWSGVASQGLGTSMLQIPNIIKRPRLLLPPMIVSAITGPMATILFEMENSAAGAGMGTSGLVGIIETFNTMGVSVNAVLGVFVVYLIVPAVLTPLIGNYMRKKGWIEHGDLTLKIGQ
jgi:hypothetical protein